MTHVLYGLVLLVAGFSLGVLTTIKMAKDAANVKLEQALTDFEQELVRKMKEELTAN